ncbi:MAG: hypothetical protein QW038_02005 [Nanopusillaceae archaeon]
MAEKKYKYINYKNVQEFIAKKNNEILFEAFLLLDRYVEFILLEACERAKANKRKRILPHDFPFMFDVLTKLLYAKEVKQEQEQKQTEQENIKKIDEATSQ